MTDEHKGQSEDAIARLLQLAGPRPAVPPDREARVEAATRAAWHGAVRARQRRRFVIGLSAALPLAATLALAMGLLHFLPKADPGSPSPTTIQQIGWIERVEGTGAYLVEKGSRSPASAGTSIHVGQELVTEESSRLALSLSRGHSVRLDGGTHLRLASSELLELDKGVVYVDSGAETSLSDGISVMTPRGLVREIGTQFEVAVVADALRVRVRRGEVQLESGQELWGASGGVELTLAQNGQTERRELSIHGPEWDWVQAVAPPFPLEGQSLSEFLAWVSRETGWRPKLADGALEEISSTIVLHGSVEGLTPMQAVEAVLPTCGLEYALGEGGELLVKRPAQEVLPTS